MIKKCEIEKIFNERLAFQRKAKRTIEVYNHFLNRFLMDFNTHPSNVTEAQLVEYLGSLPSVSQQKQMTGTLKILYRDVLKCPNKFKILKYPKRERKLPKILSPGEVRSIISVSTNLKHKAMLCLLYESGLRISELLNLKPCDIQSNIMKVFISGGKGAKDRYTTLGQDTLNVLRDYYREYKPKEYLFEGQFGGKYSATSVRNLLKQHCQRAKVKVINPHMLRHSFATHHLENNTPQSKVQNMLGHTSFKSTQIYTHVTCDNVVGLLS